MAESSREKRKHLLNNISHYLTAFVVVMKGVAKVEDPEKFGYAIFFIVVGVLIAIGTFFHTKFEHLVKNFKLYLLLTESLVVALVGYLHVKEGKIAMASIYFVASALFFISMIINLRTKKRVVH